MSKPKIEIASHRHDATRKNIPTAELETVMRAEDKSPVRVAYERRNRDLDPQLVWRGKDEQDWSDLIVQAPPLYIQEKVHPHALVEEIRRRGAAKPAPAGMPDLFADFNGLKDKHAATEFYQHDQHWSNRMILGDSLSVMASLAEREGLRGQVQCIYFDPPYGIRFNSNFQWSTSSRDVKDGDRGHVTREPEQVRAFRDTWRDGIHSYLTYLRDRLTVARDLLHESGSIFVQIGDENVHRVRAVMDEVFGEENFVTQIAFKTTDPLGQEGVASVYDYILWYSRNHSRIKFRALFRGRDILGDREYRFVDDPECAEENVGRNSEKFQQSAYRRRNATSSGWTASCTFDLPLFGKLFPPPGKKSWSSNFQGMSRVSKADRLFVLGKDPYFKQFHRDFPLSQFDNV